MTRQASGWPADVTRPIGRAVRRLRDGRGWSGERLIRELDSVGVPMTRAALTNLEAGRRENVSIAEVYAIASVLGAPPIALLVPDPGDDVTVLPDVTIDGVRATYWITGTFLPSDLALTADDDPTDPVERYQREAAPSAELREHDVLADDLAAVASVGRAGDLGDLYRQRLGTLRRFRDKIRGRGWAEPPLPDALDADTRGDTW